MSRRQRTRIRGLTMVEVVISLLLVSSILVVSLTASGNLLRNHAQHQAGVDGQLLARRLLDEITALAAEDPDDNRIFGCEVDEDVADRTTLDDVDDYHGLVLAPPTDRLGNELAEFNEWTVTITVEPAEATATGVSLAADSTAPIRRITLVCASERGLTHTAEAFVSTIATDADLSLPHQRWRSISLELSDGGTIMVDAPLKNLPVVPPGS